MKCTDTTYELYVGLNAAGEVVEIYSTLDGVDPKQGVVSIGYLETIPSDYDEVFSIAEDAKQEG